MADFIENLESPLVPVFDALWRHSLHDDAEPACTRLYVGESLVAADPPFQRQDLYPAFRKTTATLNKIHRRYLERHHLIKRQQESSAYDACAFGPWFEEARTAPSSTGKKGRERVTPSRTEYFDKQVCKPLRDVVKELRASTGKLASFQGRPGGSAHRRLMALWRIWSLPIWAPDADERRRFAADEILGDLLSDKNVDALAARHVFQLEVYPLLDLYRDFGADETYRQDLEEQLLFYFLGTSLFRYHLLEFEEAELASAFGRGYRYDPETGEEVCREQPDAAGAEPAGTGAAGAKAIAKGSFNGRALNYLNGQDPQRIADGLGKASPDKPEDRRRIDLVIGIFDSALADADAENPLSPDGGGMGHLEALQSRILPGSGNVIDDESLPLLNERGDDLGRCLALVCGVNLFRYRYENKIDGLAWAAEQMLPDCTPFESWLGDDAYRSFHDGSLYLPGDGKNPEKTKGTRLLRELTIQNWSGFWNGELILLKRMKWSFTRLRRIERRLRSLGSDALKAADVAAKFVDDLLLVDGTAPNGSLYTELVAAERELLQMTREKTGALPTDLKLGAVDRAKVVISRIVPMAFAASIDAPLASEKTWGDLDRANLVLACLKQAFPDERVLDDLWDNLANYGFLSGEPPARAREDALLNDEFMRAEATARGQILSFAVQLALERADAPDSEEPTMYADSTPGLERPGLRITVNGAAVTIDGATARSAECEAGRPVVVAMIVRGDMGNSFEDEIRKPVTLRALFEAIQIVANLFPDEPRNLPKHPDGLHLGMLETRIMKSSAESLGDVAHGRRNRRELSSRHAAIVTRRGRYYYVDLGSLQGSYIVRNGSGTDGGGTFANIMASAERSRGAETFNNRDSYLNNRIETDDVKRMLERKKTQPLVFKKQAIGDIVEVAELHDGDRVRAGVLHLIDNIYEDGVVTMDIRIRGDADL